MMKIQIFLMLWLGALLQQRTSAERSLRRMRKIVEVSDLGGGDSGIAGNPPESDYKVPLDTSIAQTELHRMLEDTQQSLSRRLKTGTKGNGKTGSDATFSETKTARSELYRLLQEEEDLSESRQLQFFSMGNEPILSRRDQTIRNKCGMTEQERSTRLFGIVSEISDSEELSNPRSERHEALDWLDQVDEAIICPSTNRVTQRYRAALLYFTLGGSGWKNCGEESKICEVSDEDQDIFQNVRWLSEEHECIWFGMYCESNTHPDSADERGMLTDIDLDDNNLVGHLPIELFGTSSLQTIIMDGNKLKGSIPTDIAQLENLKTIDLDDNDLTGTLPEELFSLTSLEIVDLNSNKFTGTLSSQIRNLVNIRFLQLDYNYMSGDLPAQDILELENICK